MSGPRDTRREYTGKHRRDSGPGVLPPAWGGRAEDAARPVADGRTASGATPMPGPGGAWRPGFWPESGQWTNAG